MDSDSFTLLEEPQSTNPHLSISVIMEILNQKIGLLSLEREFVLTQEDLTLSQVILFLFLAAGMKNMFLDKHGATSVLSAFKSIVDEKLPINLTCSIGLVENSIAQNAYRPSDIIKSRKGLTVEIGNTDAEGRLVLCDCMHWTQENFKVDCLIEESTLTGAMIVSLGASHAGIYSNNKALVDSLTNAGNEVNELVWHMPLSDYNRDMMKCEKADLNNHGGKMEAGSAQAAAFL
jgi:leucyl aminopeptidase